MCNPSSCLPFLSGRKVSTYSTQFLGMTQAEAQGLDDFVEDLCKSLGCADRQVEGKITLLGVVHKNVLEAANKSFPQAKECMAAPIQGIINGVGEAMASCMQGQAVFIQALLINTAPHIGELLKCVFGAERANQMELQMYRSVTRTTIVTVAPRIGGIIECLLPIILNIILGQLGGGGGGGLCPPPQPPTPPPSDGFCATPPDGGYPPVPPVDIFPKPNDQNRC